MKLTEDNFNAIVEGTKRVELRLNDEKRQKLQLGDIITFHLINDYNKSFKVIIVGLSNYKKLQDLINDYKIEKLISKSTTPKELIKIFNSIYTLEEQEKYGILGISFIII